MAKTSANAKNKGKRPRVNHWKVNEDVKLLQLVRRYGAQNWRSIAAHLDGRTGKSCRLRWHNHLDPTLNRNPFTKEEEDVLLAAYNSYGARWAAISHFFNGRTDNALKNHWHVLMARKKRECMKTSFQDLIQDACAEQRAFASVRQNGSLSSLKFGTVPSFSGSFPVVNPTGGEVRSHFGLSNGAFDGMMGKSFFENSVTELGSSSSAEKVHADEVSNGSGKKVLFYDFLGLGDQ